MTVQEFYDWAVAHGIKDAEIRIQYRDGGGYYCGYDDLETCYIDISSDKSYIEI